MHLGHETNKPGLCPSPEAEPQVIKPLQLIALKSHFGSLLWHYSGTTRFPPCFPSPLLSRSLEVGWGSWQPGRGATVGCVQGVPVQPRLCWHSSHQGTGQMSPGAWQCPIQALEHPLCQPQRRRFPGSSTVLQILMCSGLIMHGFLIANMVWREVHKLGESICPK